MFFSSPLILLVYFFATSLSLSLVYPALLFTFLLFLLYMASYTMIDVFRTLSGSWPAEGGLKPLGGVGHEVP